MSAIGILYTCHGCGLEKVRVEIEERAEGEDLMEWMTKVQAALGADHAARSPECSERKADIMIPVPKGTARLGEKVRS